MGSAIKAIVILVLIAIIIWGAVALFGGGDKNKEETKEIVKIGVTLPLSGDLTFLGEGIKDIMTLAKDELLETKYEYELIFEDDQIDVLEVADKLLETDGIDLIVSFGSETGIQISEVASTEKILHINIGSSDSDIADGDYNFVHSTSPTEKVRLLISELEKNEVSKVAIFQRKQEGYQAIRDAFANQLKETEIEIVSEKTFDENQDDFEELITEAKDENPDIYLILTDSPTLEILGREILEIDEGASLTSIGSFGITQEKDIFEGQWFVTSDSSKELADKLGGVSTLAVANAYDVVKMFVEAYEKTGDEKKPTVLEISEELKKLTGFEGILGKLVVNDEGVFASEAVLRKIEDGEVVAVE
jgi:ABC-type branched-subunit amino acid transport system substrate-binding protein